MAYMAKHKNAPMSASKARLVIDLIRGKLAEEALAILHFQPKRAARFIEKVLKSAVSNATFAGARGDFIISKACVDEADMYRRYRPQAKGRMHKILHRLCHIVVEVEPIDME